MSDFLSNLIDRALDRAPLLERRRPARFEPGQEMMGAATSPFENAEMRGEEIAGSHREAERTSGSPMADGRTIISPPVSPRSSLPESVEVLTTSGEGASPQRTLPPIPATPFPPGPNAAARHRETDRPHNRDEIIRTRLIETIVEKRNEPAPSTSSKPEVGRKEIPPPSPSGQGNPLRPLIIQTIERERPDSARPRRGGERAEAPSSMPLRAKPVPAPQPTVAERAQPRMNHSPRPAPGEQQRQPALPAVQVTIGRLEIRAVSSAAGPPRRTRAAAPKLSLEAYLQSRNGGSK
jgi:hypothetical protein